MYEIDLIKLSEFFKNEIIVQQRKKIKDLEEKLSDESRYQERLLRELEGACKNYEELHKINKANAKSYEKFWYKLEKYKNCISEIKRNIDSYCYGCKGHEPNKNCSYCNYKLLLKKIKEVENG